uniref:Ribosome biogenesis protein BRX1 n=1 Tax=Ogataea thermomethanolica (nom. inval.) TaxID=310468 RepID=A0A5P8D1J0_9ASCO|nr:ribosome biogenesis protein BRX1 [Ogataea thermomethanolica (nom. inval.)]QGW56826.1 ribosome biogenesis protein BRX1 [Ogataea thermomethanolica (nom. inval.)]
MSAIYRALTPKVEDHKQKAVHTQSKKRLNRQRCLLISSRGVIQRHRHFINDIHSLLPHSRKEPKLDTKKNLYELNELAELHNCNNVIYFESRKHQDLYMWLSKTPNGPSMKFHVQNLHTLEELNFSGNCLKGSRPILSFDAAFDSETHFQIAKEMIIHQFGVPPGARKSKPFIDHLMLFSITDGKIWIRNYQISEPVDSSGKEAVDVQDMKLIEIGPRFVLTLITILEGSFCGPKIYENKEYISPNAMRSALKLEAAKKATLRQRKTQISKLGLGGS